MVKIQDEMSTKISIDAVGAINSFKTLNSAVKTSINTFKAQDAQLRSSGQYSEAAAAKVKNLSKTLELQNAKLKELTERQKKVDKSSSEGQRAYLKLENQIQSTSRQIGNYSAQLEKAKNNQSYYTSGLANLQKGYKQATEVSKSYVNQLKAEGKHNQASREEYKSLVKNLENLNNQYKIQSKSLKDAEASHEKASNAVKAQKVAMKELATAVGKDSDEYSKANNQLKKLEGTLNNSNDYLNKQKIRLNESATAIASSKSKINQLGSSYKNLSDKSAKAADVVAKGKNKLANGWDEVKSGVQVASVAIGALGATALAGAKKASTLENSYKQTQNLLITGGEKTSEAIKNVNQMQKDGAKYSVEYGKSQSEIADAYQDLVKRGYTSEQALGAMRSELQASVASGDDFTDVVKVSSQTLEAFGLRSKTTEGMIKNTKLATNQLAFAADATSTGFSDLGVGMSYVGSTAKQAGYGLAETASAMGVLSNNSLESDKAGTSLRKVLNSLISPSKTGRDALKGLGLSTKDFTDQNGKLKSMTEIFEILNNKTKGMTQTQKTDVFHSLFGTTGQQAGLILANNSKELGELTEKVAKSQDQAKGQGYIAQLSAKNMGTVKNELKQFNEASEASSVVIGKAMLPALSKAAKAMAVSFNSKDGQKSLQSLANTIGIVSGKIADLIIFLTKHKKEVKAFGATFAALWATSKIIKFTKSLYGVAAALGVIKKVNPGKITTGFSETIKNTQIASSLGKNAWNAGALGKTATVAAGAGVAIDSGLDIYKAFKAKNPEEKFENTGSGIGKALGGGIGMFFGGPLGAAIGDKIGGFIGKWGGKGAKAFTDGWNAKGKDAKPPKGILPKAGYYARAGGDAVVGFFKSVSKWVSKNKSTIILALINPFASIANWFLKDTKLGKSVSKWFKNAFSGMGKAISGAWTGMGKAISGAWTGMGKAISGAWTGMTKTIGGWGKSIGKALSPVVKAFGGLVKGIGNALKPLATVLKYVILIPIGLVAYEIEQWIKAIKKLFTPLVGWIGSKFKSIGKAVSKGWKSVTNVFTGKASWEKSLTKKFSNLGKSISKTVGGCEKSIKKAWNTINKVTSTAFKLFRKYIVKPIGDVSLFVDKYVDKIIVGTIKSAWNGITKSTKSAFKLFQKYVVNPVKYVWSIINKYVVKNIVKGFKIAWSNVTKSTKSAFKLFQEYIVDPVKYVWSIIDKYVVKNIVKGFKKSWNYITDLTHDSFKLIQKYAINPIQNVWNEIKSLMGKISDKISDTVRSIKKVWGNAWDSISDKFTNIWKTIKNHASEGLNGIIRVLNSAIKGIDGVLHKFGAGKEVIGQIKEVHLATGTGALGGQRRAITKPTMAVLNDGHDSPETGNRELLMHANGTSELVQGTNTPRLLEPNAEVFNATETKMMLAGMPHFASGTGVFSSIGNFVSKATKGVTKFAANAFSDLKNMFKTAGKIISSPVKYLTGFFTKPKGDSDVTNAIAAGGYNKIKDTASKWWSTLWSMVDLDGGAAGGNWAHTPGSGWTHTDVFGSARGNGTHDGNDYSASQGTAIHAVHGGKVVRVGGAPGGWGPVGYNIVTKGDDGQYVIYQEFGHANDAFVSKGDTVKTGQKIAKLGNSGLGNGPHVHIGVSKNYPFSNRGTTTSGWEDLMKMSGGSSGSSKKEKTKTDKGLTGLIKKQVGSGFFKFISHLGSLFGDTFGSGGGSYNVDLIRKAAKAMHVNPSDSFIKMLQATIQSESGGKNIVQQIHDVNSGGNEARGILQFTPGTFNAFAVKGHKNIMSAYDQLLAFFNNSDWKHSIGRTNIWGVNKIDWLHSGPIGHRRYADGGIVTKHQMAEIAEGNKPEIIIPWDLNKRGRAYQLLQSTMNEFSKTDAPNSQSNGSESSAIKILSAKLDAVIDLLGSVIGAIEDKPVAAIGDKDIYEANKRQAKKITTLNRMGYGQF